MTGFTSNKIGSWANVFERAALETSLFARYFAVSSAAMRGLSCGFAAWIEQQHADLNVPEDDAAVDAPTTADEEPDDVWRELGSRLGRWAKQPANRAKLGLDVRRPVSVRGFHPVHRVAPTGELLIEMVAKFVQTAPATSEDLGGLRDTAGSTVVVMIDGRLRYVIAKPFHEQRADALRSWVAAFDAENGPTWPVGPGAPRRMLEAFSARAMDGRRWA